MRFWSYKKYVFSPFLYFLSRNTVGIVHSMYTMHVCPSVCLCVLLSGDLGRCWAHSTQRQPGMCLSHQLNTTSGPNISKILSLTVSKHSEGDTILSLENIHTHAQVHTTWMSCEMSKNTEHMKKLRGRSPMISTAPDVCVCVRVRWNIMHHWTIQTQTAANAIRLTSGQGSLENLGYTPHAQKLHTHSHKTHTHAPRLVSYVGQCFNQWPETNQLWHLLLNDQNNTLLCYWDYQYIQQENIMYL